MKYFLLAFMLGTEVAHSHALFVCDGNSGRSFMAETIAQKFLYHDAISRGLAVKYNSTVEENALKVLAEWNLYKHHVATQLMPEDVQNAELVLTMTIAQKDNLIQYYPEYTDKIYTLSECAEGRYDDIPDAYGKPIRFYRTVRDQIFYYTDIISTSGWQCHRHKSQND